MNAERRDRLYELMPAFYRQADADQHQQLRDLLRVIAEQVNVVEDDIARLYENWFVETCDEWVLPYIGDLIGYVPLNAGQSDDAESRRKQARILAPRRELANTIRNRRRRGTIALLELLARDASGLPARAVEFFLHLAHAQSLRHLRLDRGRTIDLRDGEALDRIGGPFDSAAHVVDIRRPTEMRSQGRYNIPSAAAFVWRMRAYPITHGIAYADQRSDVHYTFSALGNNAPLFVNPRREEDPTAIAGELEVPTPIRRRALERAVADYYGSDKSFAIWKDDRKNLVPIEQIVAADLSGWEYSAPAGKVAVDPVLGRIAFPDDEAPRTAVWVSYRYGFSADLGGGQYRRPIAQADGAVLYRVGAREPFAKLDEALWQWKEDGHARAVIEIADSETYVEPVDLELVPKSYLQIRAANGARPVIRLVDWESRAAEAARVTMGAGSRFVLDGVVLAGRPLLLRAAQRDQDDVRIAIRHCTLVPGWTVVDHRDPRPGGSPSIELEHIRGRMTIEHSIVGQIEIDARHAGALRLEIHDSIVDGLGDENMAISAPRGGYASAAMTIVRSTVIGEMRVESIVLAENSLFTGEVTAVRRQHGCVRYCHVPHGSRTPRRYQCQPDLIERDLRERAAAGKHNVTEDDLTVVRERVRPRFDSLRYGRPEYARLQFDGADAILRGANDETEMGAFHDLYQVQRFENLRARLDEYTPSRMDTGILLAD